MRAHHWHKQAAAGMLTGSSTPQVEKPLSELEARADAGKDEWTVVFRSTGPRAWNRIIKDRVNYAIEVKNAPEGLKYLRLTNTKTGDFVIVAVTRDKLTKTGDDGRY